MQVAVNMHETAGTETNGCRGKSSHQCANDEEGAQLRELRVQAHDNNDLLQMRRQTERDRFR